MVHAVAPCLYASLVKPAAISPLPSWNTGMHVVLRKSALHEGSKLQGHKFMGQWGSVCVLLHEDMEQLPSLELWQVTQLSVARHKLVLAADSMTDDMSHGSQGSHQADDAEVDVTA